MIRSCLNCMYTNIRSIMNNDKRGEIEIMLKTKNVHILGITESWGHEGIQDTELGFQGYRMFRRDKLLGDKVRGGGVILYVAEKLKAVRKMGHSDDVSESSWVKIRVNNLKVDLHVGVCY